jgi:hypothetical protein
MAQTMPFRIGADASCTDGACGQVSRIIVNPVTRQVTHLAVDPKHRHGPGRLVPVDRTRHRSECSGRSTPRAGLCLGPPGAAAPSQP